MSGPGKSTTGTGGDVVKFIAFNDTISLDVVSPLIGVISVGLISVTCLVPRSVVVTSALCVVDCSVVVISVVASTVVGIIML